MRKGEKSCPGNPRTGTRSQRICLWENRHRKGAVMQTENHTIKGDYSYPNVFYLGTQKEKDEASKDQERIRGEWKAIITSPAFCGLKFRSSWGTETTLVRDGSSSWKLICYDLNDKPSVTKLYGTGLIEMNDLLDALLRYSARRDVDVTLFQDEPDLVQRVKAMHWMMAGKNAVIQKKEERER